MLTLLLMTLAVADAPVEAKPLESMSYVAPTGLLLPELASSRGVEIYSGVRNVVSGSILLAVGLGIGAGGLYSLISAGAQPVDSSGRLVFTVLGWTFFGIGAVCAVVGIPLLIVGIVKLASRDRVYALSVSREGGLAVSF
jgi:hypothetical protein